MTILQELLFKALWVKTYRILWPKPLLATPITTEVWQLRWCPRIHRFRTESRKPVVMVGPFMQCLTEYRGKVGA